MPTPSERIATLEAHREDDRLYLESIGKDVKKILENMNQARGAWRMALIAGSAVSSFIAFVAGFFASNYTGQH